MIKKILKKIFSIQNNSYQDMIVEMDRKSEEFIKVSSEYTFKSKLEMWTIICCLRNIINQKIYGDIIETGVWKGGTLILVKKILEDCDAKKKILGFDTFEEGFEKPGELDKKIKYGFKKNGSLYNKNFNHKKFENASLNNTLSNIKKNCKNIDDLYLIKGKVENTLKKENIKDISFLMLDTDYYESTKFSLEKLYDKVSYNGIIYIDDYGNWKGAKQAVDEFFKRKKIQPFLIRTSSASRIFIKNI
tara:strand:- start:1164 stop:1901 length:738 start_codon:yes stop_codon:yes gene_type:complete